MRSLLRRNYCIANDKVLFDFADLDAWWYNPGTSLWEQHTYSYSGYDIPAEHPQFYGDEYGHTTAESCEQKGRAWWWMAALMSTVIAVMGFAGSLTMSAVKRDRGVKDYGTLVEGHSGVLDRIDSLCFAAPIFFHFTRFFLSLTADVPAT